MAGERAWALNRHWRSTGGGEGPTRGWVLPATASGQFGAAAASGAVAAAVCDGDGRAPGGGGGGPGQADG